MDSANAAQTAELAILALFNDNLEAKANASSWLTEFTHSKDSWGVFSGLLDSSHPVVPFFAAQALCDKIRLYWEGLTMDAKIHMRTFMFQRCVNFASGGNLSVTQRLAMSLAAMINDDFPDAVLVEVVRSVPMWNSVYDDLFSLITNPPNEESAFQFRMMVFDILGLLPEELYEAVLPKMRRDEAAQSLKSIIPRVLELSSTVLVLQDANDGMHKLDKLKLSCLSCLLNWIKFEITLPQLYRSGMLEILFNCTSSPLLCSAALDALSEGLGSAGDLDTEFTPASHVALNRMENVLSKQDLMQVLQRVTHLRPLFQQCTKKGNDEVCRAISHLVGALAEANISLFANNIHVAEISEFITIVLECLSHKNRTISEMCLHFWASLTNDLNDQSAESYLPVYQQLVEVLLIQCSATPKDLDLESEDADNFKQYRLIAEDALKSAYRVLGDKYMTILSNYVPQASAENWSPTESLFFLIATVAPLVEPGSKLLGGFAQAAFDITVQAEQSKSMSSMNQRLICALLRMFSSCAPWLQATQQEVDILQPTVQFIAHFLPHPSNEVRESASIALSKVSESCAAMMVPNLQNLISTYDTVHLQMGKEDRLAVIFSLSRIASYLPEDQMIFALQMIVGPHINSINSVLQSGNVSRITAEVVTHDLECFPKGLSLGIASNSDKAHLQYLHDSNGVHPTIAVVQEAWPALEEVARRFIGSREVTAAWCAMMLTCSDVAHNKFGPVLDSLIPLLGELFHQQPSSHILDLVAQHGRLAAHFGAFHHLLYSMCTETFRILEGEANDAMLLVGSFLGLQSNVVRENPAIWVTDNNVVSLDSTLNLAIRALDTNDPIVLESALDFVDTFLFGAHVSQSSDWHSYSADALSKSIDGLVLGLFAACEASVAHFQLQSLLSNVFFKLINVYRNQVGDAFGRVITSPNFMGDLFPLEEKQTILRIILSLHSHQKRFNAMIKDYIQVINMRRDKEVLLAYML